MRLAWVVAAMGVVVVAAREARACGNVTHAWISIEARDRLPEGPLKALLSRPGLEAPLRNGTMFPDGGYAIDDGYGEFAHWEPFQDAYLEWIRATYAPPWDGEAGRHVAFLFGMASHGLADQFYDSTFMDRSKAVDPGWNECEDDFTCSFDASTDFTWARLHGAQEDPERWIPEVLPSLFLARHQHEVSAETLRRGTDQVGKGMWVVSSGSGDANLIGQIEARFPFGVANIDTAPGAPDDISRAVVPYWGLLWKRLHGGTWTDAPVLTTRPLDGATGHVRIASDGASRVTLIFSKALLKRAFQRRWFRVTDAAGAEHPVEVDLFYGDRSNVVNLLPTADFEPGEQYTVTVDEGVVAKDGTVSAAPYRFHFTAEGSPDSSCAQSPAGLLTLALLASRRRRA